jgi:hypothetical protein
VNSSAWKKKGGSSRNSSHTEQLEILSQEIPAGTGAKSSQYLVKSIEDQEAICEKLTT